MGKSKVKGGGGAGSASALDRALAMHGDADKVSDRKTPWQEVSRFTSNDQRNPNSFPNLLEMYRNTVALYVASAQEATLLNKMDEVTSMTFNRALCLVHAAQCDATASLCLSHWQEALSLLLDLTALHPNDVDIWLEMGHIMREIIGRFTWDLAAEQDAVLKAMEYFQRALTIVGEELSSIEAAGSDRAQWLEKNEEALQGMADTLLATLRVNWIDLYRHTSAWCELHVDSMSAWKCNALSSMAYEQFLDEVEVSSKGTSPLLSAEQRFSWSIVPFSILNRLMSHGDAVIQSMPADEWYAWSEWLHSSLEVYLSAMEEGFGDSVRDRQQYAVALLQCMLHCIQQALRMDASKAAYWALSGDTSLTAYRLATLHSEACSNLAIGRFDLLQRSADSYRRALLCQPPVDDPVDCLYNSACALALAENLSESRQMLLQAIAMDSSIEKTAREDADLLGLFPG
jgi:tetratricopeptide (TPR) repeat protein